MQNARRRADDAADSPDRGDKEKLKPEPDVNIFGNNGLDASLGQGCAQRLKPWRARVVLLLERDERLQAEMPDVSGLDNRAHHATEANQSTLSRPTIFDSSSGASTPFCNGIHHGLRAYKRFQNGPLIPQFARP